MIENFVLPVSVIYVYLDQRLPNCAPVHSSVHRFFYTVQRNVRQEL